MIMLDSSMHAANNSLILHSVGGKQYSSKKAELIAKYKMLQKVNRDKSLNSDRGGKGKAGGTKSRHPVLMKVTT